MKKVGPIFIRDIKKQTKAKRRSPGVIDIDAKEAYGFVKEKTERREARFRQIAGLAGALAGILAECESTILESWPVRKTWDLAQSIWPVRMAQRIRKSISQSKA